MNWIYSVC